MKKLITVLCLMIAVTAAGQYPIYQTLPRDSTLVRIKPQYDTIPIIYLYSDTATFEAFGAKQRNPIAYWDFGYEVREVKAWYYHFHIGYLDRQKNPIRKSIVIFMTKTIEK